VNAPGARSRARLMRDSHLTLFVLYYPGATRRAGAPCSAVSDAAFLS